MRVLVHQISVGLDYTAGRVRREVSRKLRCPMECVLSATVTRRSLDTRPFNPEPRYVLTVRVELNKDVRVPARSRDIRVLNDEDDESARTHHGSPVADKYAPPGDRPLVVGAGPAGLFAAYALAEAGARPLLIERGQPARDRAATVAAFWHNGVLDPESNVLYGEGGAGLFSDGKLTARTKDQTRHRRLLQWLVTHGAPDSILIDAEPHLGTDRLLALVPRLRESIRSMGGEIRFGARLDGLVIERGHFKAGVVNGNEQACSACILATGHSARDVYDMLARQGVALEPKPFAVGVRVELPQAALDRAQYGRFAGDPRLGAAAFRLTRRPSGRHRACYSFCMCPGGRVIACASEPGRFTTNGMSGSRRAQATGNAGFLVPVEVADFPDTDLPALAGIELQRRIEARAFAATASRPYALPAAPLVDFLAGTVPAKLPDGCSCPRSVPAELGAILPDYVSATLRAALLPMLRELNGSRPDDVLLYAAETRSSSPVRVARDETGCSTSTAGLFPAGEGAGYAGGIVSSAIDGMRAAEAVLALRG